MTAVKLSAYKFLFIAFALGSFSGCAIVPGLHVDIEATNQGDVAVVNLDDPGSRFKQIKIIKLTPATVAEIESTLAEKIEAQSDAVLQSLANGSTVRDYLIGAGDVLGIIVWDHPELTNPSGQSQDSTSSGRLVAADGTIFYPFAGPVKVAGLSPSAVRTMLTAKLAPYIKDPQVDVRVTSYRSQRVYGTGELARSGYVALDDAVRGVTDVISDLGGLGANASRLRMVLIRDGRSYPLDLAALMRGESAGRGPVLQAGDQIHIPDNTLDQVFVLGRVNRQGPVTLTKSRASVTEVLTQAQGLDNLTSDQRSIFVFKAPRPGDEVALVIQADLSSGSGLLSAGMHVVGPRDVVVVEPNGFAQYNSVINQFLPTISALFQIDALVNRNR